MRGGFISVSALLSLCILLQICSVSFRSCPWSSCFSPKLGFRSLTSRASSWKIVGSWQCSCVMFSTCLECSSSSSRKRWRSLPSLYHPCHRIENRPWVVWTSKECCRDNSSIRLPISCPSGRGRPAFFLIVLHTRLLSFLGLLGFFPIAQIFWGKCFSRPFEKIKIMDSADLPLHW